MVNDNYENETVENDDMMMRSGFMIKVSENCLDMKIPSKCERCGLECPSKQALAKHKQEEHAKKPPGPATPGFKAKEKEIKVLKEAAKEVKMKQPQTPGSALTMAKWIRRETRSTMVGAAIAESAAASEASSAAARQATPREQAPGTPELRTVDLDLEASVSLLSNEPTASPMLNTVTTVTMFPPGVSSEEWNQVRQVEPEPEKPEHKRSRARYDDEDEEESEKKVDSRRTPEAVRMAARTPRNLDNELERMAEEGMEVELGPSTLTNLFMEVDTEEWARTVAQADAAAAAVARPVVPQPMHQVPVVPQPGVPILPTLQPRQQGPVVPQPGLERAPRGTETRDMLSRSEVEWINSADFSAIPDPPAGDRRDERLVQMAEDRDAGYEVIRLKNEQVEELRRKLDEALSLKEEYWEKVGELEGQVEGLVRENNNMRQSMEAIADWENNQEGELAAARVKVNKAKAESEKLSEHAKALQAEVVRLTAAVEAKEMRKW